ncbi:stage IV sporulation protein FB [Neobacillus notoginsengisoli]|uniref:Stage IV sporulation protein FB n=1 Tax=Neobacillus notoginsengisoli TaxID=1578198 RepID=A0A417YU04_9BACI|nr:M50 family metallopeptidase [Neobacillus notoginsengisoli]RHW40628.1 stage IV sporulation protein FB [Neobacillus notoginsengisoli]
MTKAASLLKLIHIHPLLWLAAATAALTAHFLELCMLLAIIFIHEIGHAAAALFFSWRIKRISFLPFGGVAEMDEHGNRPMKEELIVILAGPVQHLWLMAAAYVLQVNGLIPESAYLLFMKYNLMILAFNLFPIWPLDGGKLLFLLLSAWKPFPEAHEWTLICSFAFLTLFAALTLATAPLHLNIWVIAGFLYFTLFFEWKQRQFVFMRFLLERYYGNKEESLAALKPIRADESEGIIRVLAKFRRGCKHSILVESDEGEKGILDENELLHYVFAEKKMNGKVGDLFYAY